MATYISSNNNRFYVARESSYGQAAAIEAQNRIPAVKLTAKNQAEKAKRKDKTGTRTFLGDPTPLRTATTFSLKTYMAGWSDQTQEPSHGPLFTACLGGAATISQGGSVASANGPSLTFSGPHGLAPGQAVSLGGEIRFVSAVANPETVQLNAGFTQVPPSSAVSGPTATYQPASDLPSATLYDFWSPATAVQRVLYGLAVNQLQVSVNGDFHEFDFSGDACDLLDSSSFESGQAGLSSYPAEPTIQPLSYSLIPGHLGEVWMGSQPGQFFTVTKAKVTFSNGLDLRTEEFGSNLPRAIVPGLRHVSVDLTLYEQDDAGTQALYQAARQRSPISMMLQLGQQQGQLCGIYMKSVVLEVPEFDDAEKRVQWQFQNCRAQGGMNDEISVAFG